jgi:hypothetical protein
MFAAACVAMLAGTAAAQGVTGTLIGTVKDAQSGVLAGATVRLTSPALIGGSATQTTNGKGQFRFPELPPASYMLQVEVQGFSTYGEEDIHVGAGATIERTPVLTVAALATTVVVEGTGSRIDARDPGFGTRFRIEDLKTIPTRRSGMFDFIRAAPGISPTSPSSGSATTVTTVSAFGSGTNENQFLIDGTNTTCPCNGVARSEPGVDFIQEIQIQSVGASAEFGNMQGAVINVVTKQGSARFLYDSSYYGQAADLTSQPVRLDIPDTVEESGYTRARYRDFGLNLGGPVVRDRLWFFTGYQYQRDYDSQPGTDAKLPRIYEQDKIFAKLTWRLAPAWQLVQSFHDEFWVNGEQPTVAKPFEATLRRHASVPAMTFGHLTHTWSSNTLWDVRVGRFVYDQDDDPSTGNRTTPSRFERRTSAISGAPQSFGGVTIMRTTAKATVSHYRPGLAGTDHQWKMGGQLERGEHHGTSVIPTGRRFVDLNGQPSQTISRSPSHEGGQAITASAFVTDALTVGDRLTINAGVRFDHSRAISQDLRAIDAEGRETDDIVRGLGNLYTWNLWSPRLGVTAKLSADGRTMLRASYGRFSQGVLTGEISPFHPGATDITTANFVAATGDYTQIASVIGRRNLQLDPDVQAPRTDEYSVGVDRELHRRLAMALAYVRKDGGNFIGWTDAGGQYVETVRKLADGRTVPVFELVNRSADRLFRLTNPEGYSLNYNGLVMALEKRRSQNWQAFGSYTFSRAFGLQPSSGTTAAGAQVSTVAPSPAVTFGRDANDLTNARGRLANDRPHIFRVMGSVDVPRIRLLVAANFQHFSGKPWAARGDVVPTPTQGPRLILLEPRGARRLSSQSLLDLRVSKMVRIGAAGRIELMLDVLNALNDASEESLASETLATETVMSPTFGLPATFVDPRRAMIGVRVNLGR